MNPVINLQTKRANINMVSKLHKAQHAIAHLDQQDLQVKSVSIETIHPVLFIEPPEDGHPIHNTAQPFGTLFRVEVKRFGKLDHHIIWHQAPAKKENPHVH